MYMYYKLQLKPINILRLLADINQIYHWQRTVEDNLSGQQFEVDNKETWYQPVSTVYSA